MIIYVHPPAATVANYEIKQNLLSLIQGNQFGGSSASEDADMHLNTFTELCDMIHMKDVEPSAVKLRLFPFHVERMQMNSYWLYLKSL